MSNAKIFVTVLVLLLCSFTVGAVVSKEITVKQEDKMFQKNGSKISTLEIKKGDSIRFKNEDSVFHNIISFSKTMKFNTGVYGKGKSESITFNKVGKVDVECAIHPRMMLEVIVQ